MTNIFDDQAWFDAMKAKGHSPVMVNDNPDEEPENPDRIDMFAALVGEMHNGPRCKVCGWQCCQHCKGTEGIPQCDVIEAAAVTS